MGTCFIQITRAKIIRYSNLTHDKIKQLYLLLTPTPLVLGSIKLLNHEVVNRCLLSWVLFKVILDGYY